MRLFSFQIKNYKSILDSGECFVDNNTTILAGQNESGKSNILEALTKINTTNPSLKEYHIDAGKDTESKIIYKFLLNKEEIEEINEIPIFESILTVDEFGRTIISVEISDEKRIMNIPVDNNTLELELNLMLERFAENNEILAPTPFMNNAELSEFIFNAYKNLEEYDKSVYENFMNEYLEVESLALIKDILWKKVPKFILQKNSDRLPDSFTSEMLDSNISEMLDLKMLERLEGYLKKEFTSVFDEEDPQEQTNLLKEYSDSFNSDFESKYTQKKIKLELEIDKNNKICIYIQDQESENNAKFSKKYKLSQRSEGLQWYLNFFITINGENIKDGDVILIDEPGMHLHPKAQEELREQVLFNFPKNNQIIYTTHSPYLIDVNKLESIRLVEKHSTVVNKTYYEETKINEKLHAKNEDSIRPIIDAIGYRVGAELNFNTSNILICEGVSDYLYVKALLKDVEKLGITHASGVSKISNMALIYQGFGVENIIVLVDSDRAGIDARKDLIKNNILDEKIIFTTHGDKNIESSIEDIFTRKFFLKDILKYTDEEMKTAEEKNSKEIKKHNKKFSKIIFAKRFVEISSQFNQEDILTQEGQDLLNKIRNCIQENNITC